MPAPGSTWEAASPFPASRYHMSCMTVGSHVMCCLMSTKGNASFTKAQRKGKKNATNTTEMFLAT